jgi:hypothetical protein
MACRKSKESERKGVGEIERVEKKLLERFARLEHMVSGKLAPAATALKVNSGRKPLWSEIVSSAKPMIEIRLEPLMGEEKPTSAERLSRIRETIPDAEDIVPHPRAADKIPVVVPAKTKESILCNGLNQEAHGLKLVRKPILAMILGVPLTQAITTKKSTENETWKAGNIKDQ